MNHSYCRALLKSTRHSLKKKHGHIKLRHTRIDIGSDPDFEVRIAHYEKAQFIKEEIIHYGQACFSYYAKFEALCNHFSEDNLEELEN